MSSRPLPLLLVFFFACTTTTVEKKPAPGGEGESSQPTDPAAGDEASSEAQGGDETPEPDPEPAVVPKVVLSGELSKVDVTYGRAGQYIALDMKGDASMMSTSPKNVAPSAISVAKTTKYELLYPELGACDAPPELTIEKGKLTLVLQRAGKPNGTISGCHFLAAGVKAPDGGFQARLVDVPIAGGGTISELLVDLAGPKS